MKKDPFGRQIDDLRERVEVLFHRAHTHPEATVRDEALEELSNTLEELQVAGEELRQQNEELAAARSSIEVERQRYQELFDFAPDGYLATDPLGVIREANQAAASLLAVPPDFLIKKPLVLFVAEEDRRSFHLRLKSLAEKERLENWEVTLQPHRGKPFPAIMALNLIRDLEGKLLGVRWLIRNVAEQKQMEDGLRESGERLRRILEQSPIGIQIYDSDGQLVFVNKACLEVLGVSNAAEVKGFRLFEDPNLSEEGKRKLEGGEVVRFEVAFDFEKVRGSELYSTTRSGVIHLDVLIGPLSLGKKGTGTGYLIYVQDITERKRMEEKLHALSLKDELTGLYNRRGFLALAEQQLRLSERTKKRMHLYFVDLDGLKYINDEMGHEAGDATLMEAANLFKKAFRESDIIARIGGDEFAVLAVDTEETTPEVMISRLQKVLDTRNAEKGRRYKIRISIGIASYDPENPCSLDKLISRADESMYQQKRSKQV